MVLRVCAWRKQSRSTLPWLLLAKVCHCPSPSASSLHSLCHGWVHAVVKAEGCGYVRLVLTDQPHAYSNNANILAYVRIIILHDDYQYAIIDCYYC